MRRLHGIIAMVGLTAGVLGATPAEAQVYPPGTTYYGTNGWTYVPPRTVSYATYGLPGNYYHPTYPSYLPYTPVSGVQHQGTGYPVPAITFTNPNGGTTTLVQSSVGQQPGLDLYYNAGYPGHSAPRPLYSYNQTPYPTNLPTFPTYGPVSSGTQTGLANLIAPSSLSTPISPGLNNLTGMSGPAFVGSPPTPGFIGAPPTPGFIGGTPIP